MAGVLRRLEGLRNRFQLWRLRAKGVKIGAGCRFSGKSDFGSEPYLITLGNHVGLGSKITFITHDGGTWVFRDQERFRGVINYGWINVLDNCVIGEGVLILPGVTIGPNSIVAAGSVVTRNIPPNVLASGNPAKPVMSIEQYAEWSLAANPGYDPVAYARDKKTCLLGLPLKGYKNALKNGHRMPDEGSR